MKKVLFWSLAALVLAGCSKNMDFTPPEGFKPTFTDADVAYYEKMFNDTFGEIDDNHDWGFGGASSARAITRASAVVPGDPFTVYENTDALYKSAVPTTATKMADIDLSNQNGYQNISEIELTTGTHSLHLWGGSRDFYVNGNVTFEIDNDQKSVNQARFYVLPGKTLTLNAANSSYINNLEIYVANNATLNYSLPSIYYQTGGGKIFNRGTTNFTANTFAVSSGAVVYNEGTINAKTIDSQPASGMPSFLYNYGDIDLEGDFKLQSTAHFYNEGNITIPGQTEITQSGIWWINKGHYTTNTFLSRAWNTTCYNYCQLIVQDAARIMNGQFHMMDGSYAEIKYGIFDNIEFDMHNNAGMNITHGSMWGRDGADFRGKYSGIQGFVATSDNDKVWVRLGGDTYIPSHNGGAFHVRGANLTLGYQNVKFYNDTSFTNQWVETWNPALYWNETTEEALRAVNDGRSTWQMHNVTKLYTGDDFALVTVTKTAGECAVTWTPNDGGGEVVFTPTLRIMGEDLSVEESSDFDFNDVVFDVMLTATGAKIRLMAAGGTLPLFIGDESHEVHKEFGYTDSYPMINTSASLEKNASKRGWHPAYDNVEPVIFEITGTFATEGDIPVKVYKNNEWKELTARRGNPASKFGCPVGTEWQEEFLNIDLKWNGKFKEWVNDATKPFWK